MISPLTAVKAAFLGFLAFLGTYNQAAAEVLPQLIESPEESSDTSTLQALSTQTTFTMRPSVTSSEVGKGVKLNFLVRVSVTYC